MMIYEVNDRVQKISYLLLTFINHGTDDDLALLVKSLNVNIMTILKKDRHLPLFKVKHVTNCLFFYRFFAKIKVGANRANILANIARQHLLPKMLARFAVATNMLPKGKIPQNVALTFINMLINVGQL